MIGPYRMLALLEAVTPRAPPNTVAPAETTATPFGVLVIDPDPELVKTWRLLRTEIERPDEQDRELRRALFTEQVLLHQLPGSPLRRHDEVQGRLLQNDDFKRLEQILTASTMTAGSTQEPPTWNGPAETKPNRAQRRRAERTKNKRART